MKTRRILAVLMVLAFLSPILAFAQEKATVVKFDPGSRQIVLKVGDKEVKAKVKSEVADAKGDLLKEGTKIMATFEDRGGGDIRLIGVAPR